MGTQGAILTKSETEHDWSSHEEMVNASAADRNCTFLEADGHSTSSGQQVNQVHKLDLADPADHQAAHGLADLANSLGWECWRTATLDDKPLKLSSKVIRFSPSDARCAPDGIA